MERRELLGGREQVAEKVKAGGATYTAPAILRLLFTSQKLCVLTHFNSIFLIFAAKFYILLDDPGA